MKKLGFVILGLSLMLSSCLKENEVGRDNTGAGTPAGESSEQLVEKIITVTVPQTRTALAENGKDVVWTAGDQIAVWDGYACRKFVMKGEPKGNTAEFRGFVHYKSPKTGDKYYAVFPYSETFKTEIPPADNLDGVGYGYARMLFPFSQYQTAVEKSFDTKAAFAIAESSDIENLTFTPRTTLLKFSLADNMNDIVAVKFRGNESNDYIWGTVSMRFLDNGELYPGVINKPKVNSVGRGRDIILRNNDQTRLTTGVDYYMAIPATSFDRGYKLTFVHEDGTESSRSSSKSIEYNTDHIYELSQSDITRNMVHTFSNQYIKESNIQIASKVIKGNFADTLIIRSDEKYTIESSGIYFIEPGADVTLDTRNTPISKLVIVGNHKFEKSTLKQTSSVKLEEDGIFAVKNLDYIFNYGGYLLQRESESVQNFNYIGFERCTFTYDSTYPVVYSNEVSVDRMSFYYNDFYFSSISSDLKLIQSTSTSTVNFNEVSFDGNLFCHTGDFDKQTQYSFSLFSGANKTVGTCSFVNNTVYRLTTRTAIPYYINGTISHAYCHNNLFYLPNIPTATGRVFESQAKITDDSRPTNYGVSVYTEELTNTIKFSDTVDGVFKLGDSPFTEHNPAKRIFKRASNTQPNISDQGVNGIGAADRPLSPDYQPQK